MCYNSCSMDEKSRQPNHRRCFVCGSQGSSKAEGMPSHVCVTLCLRKRREWRAARLRPHMDLSYHVRIAGDSLSSKAEGMAGRVCVPYGSVVLGQRLLWKGPRLLFFWPVPLNQFSNFSIISKSLRSCIFALPDC